MIAHVCDLKVRQYHTHTDTHTHTHTNIRKQASLSVLFTSSCSTCVSIPFACVPYLLCNQPGDFVHTLGDAHVYLNHVEPLLEQVRTDGSKLYPLAAMHTWAHTTWLTSCSITLPPAHHFPRHQSIKCSLYSPLIQPLASTLLPSHPHSLPSDHTSTDKKGTQTIPQARPQEESRGH